MRCPRSTLPLFVALLFVSGASAVVVSPNMTTTQLLSAVCATQVRASSLGRWSSCSAARVAAGQEHGISSTSSSSSSRCQWLNGQWHLASGSSAAFCRTEALQLSLWRAGQPQRASSNACCCCAAGLFAGVLATQHDALCGLLSRRWRAGLVPVRCAAQGAARTAHSVEALQHACAHACAGKLYDYVKRSCRSRGQAIVCPSERAARGEPSRPAGNRWPQGPTLAPDGVHNRTCAQTSSVPRLRPSRTSRLACRRSRLRTASLASSGTSPLTSPRCACGWARLLHKLRAGLDARSRATRCSGACDHGNGRTRCGGAIDGPRAQAGRYVVWCPVAGHCWSGMSITVVVFKNTSLVDNNVSARGAGCR